MPLNERTAVAVFIDVAILIVLLLYSLVVFNNNEKWNNKTSVLVHILILSFCVFCFWDTDFYGLHESLDAHSLDFYDNFFDQLVNVHVEPFHFIVYELVGRNYFLYRLVLFGLGYLFFNFSASLLGCHNCLSVSLFCITYLWVFSYSRVSFGVASFFFGFLLIIRHKNVGHILGGMACLVLCYFVHKSMVVLFPLIIPSLLRLDRSKWLFALIFVTIIYLVIPANFLETIFSYETDNESLSQTLYYGNYYLEGFGFMSGFRALLKISQFVSVVLLFVCLITGFNKMRQEDFPYSINVLFNYVVWLFVVIMILLLRTSLFSAIFYRIMNMIYIPIVLLMSVFFVKCSFKARLIDRVSVAFCSIVSLATVAYQYYCLI